MAYARSDRPVTLAAPGGRVVLQVRRGKTWLQVARASTTHGTRYTFRVKLRGVGKHRLRVIKTPGPGLGRGVSQPVVVRVRR